MEIILRNDIPQEKTADVKTMWGGHTAVYIELERQLTDQNITFAHRVTWPVPEPGNDVFEGTQAVSRDIFLNITSVRSPRILFIFITHTNMHRIKVSQRYLVYF